MVEDELRALLPRLLYYGQCDEEGIMCIASRQAVEEAAAALRDLAAERDALREELRQQVDAAEAERGRLAAWQARVWDALRADLDALDDDADEPIEDAFRRWFPRLNAALGEGGGDG